ncbi:hypothetical protein [Dankookia rubra]|uniref:hypothetical protein n=1 Tax=Dankookia rubra TaxID=1442381 RepID=UPI001F502475|nr:hypothetical protein [Dankookia rubra]
MFVVSRGTRRAKLTAEAAVVLSQHGTVAPVTLHQSVAFPSAAISGLGAQEYEPAGTSAAEVQQLWTYIRGKVNKQASKPARKPTHV